MTNMEVNEPRERSTFVSVVAWIFIALSGLGVLIGILQNIVFGLVFSQEEFKKGFEQSAQQDGMPEYVQFIFENFQLFLIIILLLTALLLTASIGLLLRKSWARRIFIAYMFFTAVYLVVGTLVQAGYMNEMMQPLDSQTTPSSFMDFFKAIQYTIMVFNIGFGLVFGWIGWKLMRPAIREEFAAEVRA